MGDHPIIMFHTPSHPVSDFTTTRFIEHDDRYNQPPAVPMQKSEGPFWQSIDGCLQDEAEKIVIYCFFLYGMNSTEIYQMYPNKFRDVEQVSEIRREVLLSISGVNRAAY